MIEDEILSLTSQKAKDISDNVILNHLSAIMNLALSGNKSYRIEYRQEDHLNEGIKKALEARGFKIEEIEESIDVGDGWTQEWVPRYTTYVEWD